MIRPYGIGHLTLAAPFIRRQLETRIARALITSQRIYTALLAPPVVGPRTFVHL